MVCNRALACLAAGGAAQAAGEAVEDAAEAAAGLQVLSPFEARLGGSGGNADARAALLEDRHRFSRFARGVEHDIVVLQLRLELFLNKAAFVNRCVARAAALRDS